MSDKKGIIDVVIATLTEAFKSLKGLFDRVFPKNHKGKKIYNWIIVIALVVLVAMSYNLMNQSMKPAKTGNNYEMVVSQDEIKGEELIDEADSDHKKEKEEELETILKEMQGGGKVVVRMHFASSEEKIVAREVNSNDSVTKEEDNDGGTREIKSTQGGETIVTLNEGDKTIPVVTKVIEPEILGVVVVADKASSKMIRDEMREAVATLYHLNPNRVQVYPTGCEYDN